MTLPQSMSWKAKADPNAPKWWEKTIVKRSASSIEHMVDTMMEDSQFLQRAEAGEASATDDNSSSPQVLSLNRQDVQAGALLGKGSFSVVLEVTDISPAIEEREERAIMSQPGQRYAIKHLRPDLIQKNCAEYFQDAAADLIMEAKYLGALNHPGILRLRGIAEEGVSAYAKSGDYDSFFLLTDRLDGTLKERISEYQCIQQEESLLECFQQLQGDSTKDPARALQESNQSLQERILIEKLNIALQLARALRYLHEQNLIFRDLKPQNVGLKIEDGETTVQLFDFGFCRELPSPKSSYSSMPSTDSPDSEDAVYYMSGKGSLMYLAPEVLGSGRYNQKVDCYSFAMVLYELLTLNKPFHAAANINVFRELICHHKARPPLEFSDIPTSIQDLIRHAWDDNVYDRWTMRKTCDRLEEIYDELVAESMAREHEDIEEYQEEAVSGDQAWTPLSVNVCGGGEALGFLTDFAFDMRRAYEILTGQSKFTETASDLGVKDAFHGNATPFKSSPMDSVGSITYDSMLVMDEGVLSCPTASTQDSTPDSSASFGMFRRSTSTATEEPLEVTLEQTMSMDHSGDDDGVGASDEEDIVERERRTDDAVDGRDMEMRCPPSPPKRTISAPLGKHPTSIATGSPTSVAATMMMDEGPGCPPPVPIARRASCTGRVSMIRTGEEAIFYQPMARRLSCSGVGSGSVNSRTSHHQWMPPTVEMRC